MGKEDRVRGCSGSAAGQPGADACAVVWQLSLCEIFAIFPFCIRLGPPAAQRRGRIAAFACTAVEQLWLGATVSPPPHIRPVFPAAKGRRKPATSVFADIWGRAADLGVRSAGHPGGREQAAGLLRDRDLIGNSDFRVFAPKVRTCAAACAASPSVRFFLR